MTFAEKLLRLRKREGLSQEALAEQLGVSRQAVSRWEQGTALPDGAKLLPCARIFSVSVDWLLDEELGWEDQPAQATAKAPASRNWKWYLAGGLVSGAGVLGLVVMGILSAIYPAVVSESPVGADWTRVYTGLPAFLKFHGVEWLFALGGATAIAGVVLLAVPTLREREKGISRFSSLWAGGVAGCFCALGNQIWQYQTGQMRGSDVMLLWISLAGVVFCAARLLAHIHKEPNGQRRRRDQTVAALFLAAQALLLPLTAEIGLGLVGMALHGALAVLTAWTLIYQGTGRKAGR